MNMTTVFAPLTKSVDQEDGSVIVYGKATDGSLDRDQQRCDPSWLREAMPAWYNSGGNVREQHDPRRAVGKAIDHEVAEDGHYVTARIVDPVAVAKTRAGVFTGFSIGIRNPKISKSADAPNGLLTGGEIVELSLCDRPANPECLITLVKSAKPGMNIKASDFDSKRMLVRVEELIEKSSGTSEMTVTLAESLPREQVEALTEAVDGKAADDLSAPAPGQVCDDCGTDGHLNCGTIKSMTGCGCCDQCTAPAAKAANPDVAADILNKVDNGLGDDETPDIDGAEQAIAIIAGLIQSEAKNLATAPTQGCDIDLLMQAVHALCWFKKREEAEQGGLNPALVGLAAEPEIEKAKYSAEELRQMLKDGKAMKNPNGDPSYPIGDKEDLQNAIHAVGRGSGDHDAIRAYIKRRAKALGASDMIPDSWNGSDKAETPGETKAAEEVLKKTVSETVEKNMDELALDVEKTVEPEAEKAVAEPVDIEQAIAAAIEKAFSSETLEKEDNPIRKTFTAIVEASTKPAAEALAEMGARLEKVEAMAVPGGPALRRTDVERVQSRKNDLSAEVLRYKALASSTEDHMLRKGYAQKAAQLEAEIKAL